MRFLPLYISLYLSISVIPIVVGTTYIHKSQKTEFYLFHYSLVFFGFGLMFSLFVNLIIYKVLMKELVKERLSLALAINFVLLGVSLILIFCFKDTMKIMIFLGVWGGVSLGLMSNMLALISMRMEVIRQSIDVEKQPNSDTKYILVPLE